MRVLDGRLPGRADARKRFGDSRDGSRGGPDQLQEMALVAQARRELLLRAHRHRLSKEDLEDCYSQATLELLAQARGRGVVVAFSTRAHMANVLEQRFVSRIHDRRRALRGRSPVQAALNNALPLGDGGDGGIEVADVRAEIERLVMLRTDLRSLGKVIHDLTHDQRLVLISSADSGIDCAEFCRRHGWSKEKYRKVAQRARARLRELLAREQDLAREEDFCIGGVPSGLGGRRGE
jgi:DNA-directed RNA polymerase specialized sigma24 family protein